MRNKIIVFAAILVIIPIVIGVISNTKGTKTTGNIKIANVTFKSTDSPTFELDLKTKTLKKISFLPSSQAFAADPQIHTEVFFDGKAKKEISTQITRVSEGKYRIVIPKLNSFQGGVYSLKVTTGSFLGSQTFTQDFNWGVLAINTPKSIYLPGENVDLAMAVLNEQGKMDCTADLTLQIKDPKGKITTLSSKNKSIQVNPSCKIYDYNNIPDFQANFKTTVAGNYPLILKATTKNGSFQITDTIKVQNNVSFDISRSAPTRIYPPITYPVGIEIKPNQDFSGVIREAVPSSFTISQATNSAYMQYSQVKTSGDQKLIEWSVKMGKGKTYFLGYNFKAPNLSPYLFTFSPLVLVDSQENTVFREQRSWEIASDSTTIDTITTTAGQSIFTGPSGQRHVVRTTNQSGSSTGGKRTFALFNQNNTTTLELYYSDNPDSGTWTDIGALSSVNTMSGDMVWDETNNVLYIAYARNVQANNANSGLFYRRVSNLTGTPSLGAAQTALAGALGGATYAGANIEIGGNSATNNVYMFVGKSTAGASPTEIDVVVGGLNTDTPTFSTTTLVTMDGATTGGSANIAVTRSNSNSLVLFYYQGDTNHIRAMRHLDSDSFSNSAAWQPLSGTTSLGGAGSTLISSDALNANQAGSVVGTSNSNVVWFSWVQNSDVLIHTRGWDGSSLGPDFNFSTITGGAPLGCGLTTDGTYLYIVYEWGNSATSIVYQKRSVTDVTNDWSGSVTVVVSSGAVVQTPNVSKKIYQNSLDIVYEDDTGGSGGTTRSINFASVAAAQSYSIAGAFQQSDESTAVGNPPCDGTAANDIGYRVNGGAENTASCSPGTSFFTVTATAFAGDTLTIYSRNTSYPANTVIVLGSSTGPTTKLYQNEVVLQDESGAGITNASIGNWDTDNDPTYMLFTVNSGNLAVKAPELHVTTGDIFAPGGTVKTTGNLHMDDNSRIDANFDVDIGGNLTSDSGVTDNFNSTLEVRGGSVSFNGGSENFTGVVTIYNTGTIGGSAAFAPNDLVLDGGGTTTLATLLLVQNSLTVGKSHTLNGGTTSQSIDINPINGADPPFVVNGTFIPGNSNVSYEGDGNPSTMTVAALNYYDLAIEPSSYTTNLTINAAGPITVYDNFTMTSNSTSVVTTTFNLGGKMVVNGSTSLSNLSNATATLSTTGSNYEFRTGALTIGTGTTVQANGSNFYVAGNFTNNGTFTAGTSTVILSAFSTQTLTGSATPAITFNNLTIAGDSQATIKFTAAKTFKVLGLFSVPNGANINSTTASQWFMFQGPSATESVKAGQIANSGCDASSTTVTVSVGRNGGNNGTCWDFSGAGSVSLPTIKGKTTIQGNTTFK